jgi:hypothetical protein
VVHFIGGEGEVKIIASGFAVVPIVSAVLTIFGVISVNGSFVICAICGILLWLFLMLNGRGAGRSPLTSLFPLGYAAALFIIGFVFRVGIDSLK